MIALSEDCLVFKLASGEAMPYSADMISVELMGETAQFLDEELVQHAANGVFHYFKYELGVKTVTVGEFAGALEKVLQGFQLNTTALPASPRAGVIESDLRRLARESENGCELFFFPRLKEELRQHLRHGPRLLRFSGLRGCVMHLVGVRRRTPRCRELEDRIVYFLRECLTAEARDAEIVLVVE